MLVCFGSLSCCRNQMFSSLRSPTDGWTFPFRIFWWRAAKQPQTITLPPPCSTVAVIFFWNPRVPFFPRCNRTRTFQKVKLLLRQSAEYFPRSLVSSGFVLGTVPSCHFCLTSCFFMVESWTLTWTEASGGLQFFRCCSGFFCDLLDESSPCSRGHFCREGSSIWDNGPVLLFCLVNGPRCGSSPKAAEMAL